MEKSNDTQQAVQLEIDSEKLSQLFASGLICAAEVRCLNAHSKQIISDLCLTACAKNMRCTLPFLNTISVILK